MAAAGHHPYIQCERRKKLTIAIYDQDHARWVWRLLQSPSSMAWTMHNGQPWWLYYLSRSMYIVSSKDILTSSKSQLQTRLPRGRLLSMTGWIAMVSPNRLSYWEWNGWSKQETWSLMMQRHFGRSSHQPTSQCWSSASLTEGKSFAESTTGLRRCRNWVLLIDRTVKDYNLWTELWTNDTDVAHRDTAKTIAKMSK